MTTSQNKVGNICSKSKAEVLSQQQIWLLSYAQVHKVINILHTYPNARTFVDMAMRSILYTLVFTLLSIHNPCTSIHLPFICSTPLQCSNVSSRSKLIYINASLSYWCGKLTEGLKLAEGMKSAVMSILQYIL